MDKITWSGDSLGLGMASPIVNINIATGVSRRDFETQDISGITIEAGLRRGERASGLAAVCTE